MKIRRQILVIAAAALALTGCYKEIAPKTPVTDNGELAVIPMESNGSSTRGYVEGSKFQETIYESLHKTVKASTDTVYRTMQISTYLYPQNGEQKNYFVDKTYAQGPDGLWHNYKGTDINPIYWPVGGALDFLAYSISKADSKDVTAVWDADNAASLLTLNVPAENSQNDILYASASKVKAQVSAQAVSMKFKHAQAWIEFVLTGTVDENTGKAAVHFKRIELEDICNAGSLTISNNNGNATARWDFSGERKQDIEVDNCYGIDTLGATAQYLDMLIPEQAKTAFVLYYTLGTDTKELSYRFTTDQKTWLAGEKYIYKINVSTQEITVEPSVTEWRVPFKNYTISAVSKAYTPSRGTTSVEYTDTNKATIKAEAVAGFEFYRWLNVDGSGNILGISAENPHQVVAEGDSAYVAEFNLTNPYVSGVFSVSATKKVKFTRGNMVWDGDCFGLESEQAAYPTSWDVAHVGHFYWSKDAEKAYAETYDDTGATASDIFFTNGPLDQTKPNPSFTCNGKTGVFRTLSGGYGGSEWEYLIETRSCSTIGGKANARYAMIKVDGENGLLIFPDEFFWNTETMGTTPSDINNKIIAWSSVPEYTAGDFAAMESAGCVFLPAACSRDGSSVYNAGSFGSYWSASSGGGTTFACLLHFVGEDNIPISAGAISGRFGGRPVRLVSEL